jgi:hypothetical protein
MGGFLIGVACFGSFSHSNGHTAVAKRIEAVTNPLKTEFLILLFTESVA